MRFIRSILAGTLLLPLIFLGLGCYSTEHPLGSEASATVDPAFVGNYTITDNGKTSSIVIRIISDHLYYVEWMDGTDGKQTRMVGYTALVNGVTFANLRNLTDDGSIDKKYLEMRVGMSADHKELTLRNLKEEFFEGRDVGSSEDLEKVIATNLENEQMYDGAPVTATRAAIPANTNQ